MMKKTKVIFALALTGAAATCFAACGETEAKTYKVTFDTVGGSTVTEQTVTEGDSALEPLSVRDGYILTGWSLNGEKYDFTVPVTGDVTLQAIWETPELPEPPEQKFTVTAFDYDGTKLGEVVCGYGEEADFSGIKSPSHAYPEVYEFSGWDKQTDRVTDDMTVTAVYTYRSLPEEVFDFTLLPDDTYEIAFNDSDYLCSADLTGAWGIPESYKNKPVSKIAAFGLYYEKGAEQGLGVLNELDLLFIPESVKVIDGEAFAGYWGEKLVLAGVEYVYARAFSDCVTNVMLPATVKEIEPFAFYGFGLMNDLWVKDSYSINLSDGCTRYRQTDGVIYSMDGSELVYVDGYRMLTEFTVPASVKVVYPATFANAWNLQTLVFEGDVKTVGASAFFRDRLQSVTFNGTIECVEGYDAEYSVKSSLPVSGLIVGAFQGIYWTDEEFSFSLPRGLKRIGDYAFYSTPIKEIALDGIEHVGKGAFYKDASDGVEKITVTNSDYYYSDQDKALIEKGTGPVYNGKAGDTFLLYAGGIGRLQAAMLDGIRNQTAIDLDDYITDTYAVPEGVTAIASYAFANFRDVRHLIIPEGVTELPPAMLVSGTNVFVYNEETGDMDEIYIGLSSVSLPSTLKAIRSWNPPFYEIYSNEFVPAIQMGAPVFEGFLWENGCNLETVEYWSVVTQTPLNWEIPASVAHYEELGFFDLYASAVSVQDGNENYISFGGWVFEKLEGRELKLIQIPAKPEIDNGRLVFPDTGDYKLTVIGKNAGYAAFMEEITEIVFPDTVREIGDYAFEHCGSLEKVTFPAKLGKLGDGAFSSATGLREITFLGTMPPVFGKDVFAGNASFGESALSSLEAMYVPNGDPDSWYAFFESYASSLDEKYFAGYGDNYFAKIVSNRIYRLHTGDAYIDIAACTLFSYPGAKEDGKYFWGWYTAEGERVGNYKAGTADEPFRGVADDDMIVHLYARFEDTPYETGNEYMFAYLISETARDIPLNEGITYFAFTPASDGVYTLQSDADFSGTLYCGTYDEATGQFTQLWPQWIVDEETGNWFFGFEMKAGETYYFLLESEGGVTADISVSKLQ